MSSNITTPRLFIVSPDAHQPDVLLTVDPTFDRVIKEVGLLDFTQLTKKPYVALVGAILGQKISFTEARKLRSQLYTTFGNEFSHSDVDGSDKWRTLRFYLPADKVAIVESVNEFLRGVDDVGTFLSSKTNVESLEAHVKGIGPWTVKNTLLVSGLDMDVFPSEDYFIRKRLQRLYNLTKMPTPSQTEQMSLKWKPYRGYFAWYLWRWF